MHFTLLYETGDPDSFDWSPPENGEPDEFDSDATDRCCDEAKEQFKAIVLG